MSENKESFQINGDELLAKVKNIIKQGNAKKIRILNKDGGSIVEFPLTVGVVGTVIAPVLAAIGAMAALISECTIEIEK